MFLPNINLPLQISIANHPQDGATIPQKKVSLSQPNSLPQPTSFLTALPILKLSSPLLEHAIFGYNAINEEGI